MLSLFCSSWRQHVRQVSPINPGHEVLLQRASKAKSKYLHYCVLRGGWDTGCWKVSYTWRQHRYCPGGIELKEDRVPVMRGARMRREQVPKHQVMWDRGPGDTQWSGSQCTWAGFGNYRAFGLELAVDIKNTVQGPWGVSHPHTGQDILAPLRPLIPATCGLTCAGEEGPGQVLWVVEPREHAWGRGPAEQVQLCANL